MTEIFVSVKIVNLSIHFHFCHALIDVVYMSLCHIELLWLSVSLNGYFLERSHVWLYVRSYLCVIFLEEYRTEETSTRYRT